MSADTEQRPAPWDANPDAPLLRVERVVYWKSDFGGYFHMAPEAHWAPPKPGSHESDIGYSWELGQDVIPGQFWSEMEDEYADARDWSRFNQGDAA